MLRALSYLPLRHAGISAWRRWRNPRQRRWQRPWRDHPLDRLIPPRESSPLSAFLAILGDILDTPELTVSIVGWNGHAASRSLIHAKLQLDTLSLHILVIRR